MKNSVGKNLTYTILLTTLLLSIGCRQANTPAELHINSEKSKEAVPSAHGTKPHTASPGCEISFITASGGAVQVGSFSSEPGRDAGLERAQIKHVGPFEMSRSEITVAQWCAIVEPSRTVDERQRNMPKTGITWHEAKQFCELLSIATGIRHRLPTEIEWEYACRAGGTAMFSPWCGNCTIEEAVVAFHRGDTGKLFRGIKAGCNADSGQILPVGQFAPNRLGFVDLHGNCWEWISLEDTLSEPPSPLHAPIRGGSAISTNPLECRAANRAWQIQSNATDSIGFRVVRSLER